MQLHLQSVSPSLKGQDQNTSRYGVFSQQLPSRSQPDNKENTPEVGVGTHFCACACAWVRCIQVWDRKLLLFFPPVIWPRFCTLLPPVVKNEIFLLLLSRRALSSRNQPCPCYDLATAHSAAAAVIPRRRLPSGPARLRPSWFVSYLVSCIVIFL